jgi:hypothetical protein
MVTLNDSQIGRALIQMWRMIEVRHGGIVGDFDAGTFAGLVKDGRLDGIRLLQRFMTAR